MPLHGEDARAVRHAHGDGTADRGRTAPPVWRCDGLAGRKPRLPLRLPGVFLFRFAERAFLAVLFHDPPRFTRFSEACALVPFNLVPPDQNSRSCCVHHARRNVSVSPTAIRSRIDATPLR